MEVVMTHNELVEALKKYALDHYCDGGWDVIVECYGNAEISEILTEDKCQTLEDAIKSFEPLVDIWADRQADARYYREGNI
jgi:hypothetical protein